MVGEQNTIEVEIVAATVENHTGIALCILAALRQTACRCGGNGTSLRTQDKDNAVAVTVHDLDVAVACWYLHFADEHGDIEINCDVIGKGLSVDGTAKSKRSAAKCRKDFHGISL